MRSFQFEKRWLGIKSNWMSLRLMILLSVDALCLLFSYWLSFVLRVDDIYLGAFREPFRDTALVILASNIIAFYVLGMYRQIWRFANIYSAFLIVKSVAIGTIAFVGFIFLYEKHLTIPRSVPVIFILLTTALITLVRFSWRMWCVRKDTINHAVRKRCLIYGAGAAGAQFARQVGTNPKFPFTPIGFIDDDRNKVGRILHGIKILGTGEDLGKLVSTHKITTVIITLHRASGKNIRHIVELCLASGVTPLIMPELASTLSQEIVHPRSVDIKDLLCRSPKETDLGAIRAVFSGRSILITGAGGSIGSEICRQVAFFQPKCIIMLESSEYNLYRIELELREKHDCTNIELYCVLGSTTDSRVVHRVFKDFSPHVVLHAAAYKHVPLVEANPLEGIINNVLGTKIVAEAAILFKATHFLLISTDKAVRPTNIMGASKRACEMLVQALYLASSKHTKFASVRFGNVLGSSGSVIPRFMEQIQAGGPVTVTHPDITRYFMLTNEAVGLVLQALALSKANEIFVLNMGEPVRIFDMAKQLILLAGKEPGRDIEIIFTGLRPGEKLFEELILEGSEQQTAHGDLFIASPVQVGVEQVLENIDQLLDLAYQGSDAAARSHLSRLINHDITATITMAAENEKRTKTTISTNVH